jgi:hypothetical protein
VFSKEFINEQRIYVEFCFKVWKIVGETHNMLHEANGKDTLSQTMIYEFFKHFKKGRASMDGHGQSGQFQTARVKNLSMDCYGLMPA